MTVSDLISILSTLPSDSPVHISVNLEYSWELTKEDVTTSEIDGVPVVYIGDDNY